MKASGKDCLAIKIPIKPCNMAEGSLVVAKNQSKESVSQSKDSLGLTRRLQKRDSGYLSPVVSTPESTPGNITPSRMKSLGHSMDAQAQPARSSSGPAASGGAGNCHGGACGGEQSHENIIRRQSSMPKLTPSSTNEPPVGLYTCQSLPPQQQPHQQPQQQETFNYDDLSIFYMAFKCRESNKLTWITCKHPYCVQVRNNWDHMRTCYDGQQGGCDRCRRFEILMYRHAESCFDEQCPVEMCRSLKHQLRQEYNGYISFSNNNSSFMNQGRNSLGSSLLYDNEDDHIRHSLSQFECGNLPEDSPTARFIGTRADEIVKKLDMEEPLLPPPPPPPLPSSELISAVHATTSVGRPSSLGASLASCEDIPCPTGGGAQGMLSPIAEKSEDVSSPSSAGPRSLVGRSLPSQQAGFSSYKQDSPFVGAGGVGVNSNSSLGVVTMERGEEKENIESEYPQQEVLCKFRTDQLTVGPDNHYYQTRDYDALDDIMKSGGFGSIRCGTDLTSKYLFAIKTNNKDEESIIESIRTEARMLQRLVHVNIIQMYGAVMDKEKSGYYHPTSRCKLMMELAEHGCLSDMLEDPETREPMPLDREQALYYFWQLLEGVKYLHDNGVLHLDIKGSNLLLFEQGRTLKICDFGTAVRVDEIASSVGKNLGTPQFASPEICKQQEPHFASDMWSSMCVLVEMITARKPWDHKINRDTAPVNVIFMVGNYGDHQMESHLLPSVETIEGDIIELMKLVFRANYQERPTAMELLTHGLIANAYMYESAFDDYEEEDYEDYSSLNQQQVEDNLLSLASSQIPNSGSFPAITEQDILSKEDHKRLSKDSGMGIDLESDSNRRSYGRMASGRSSDSGVETPYTDRLILGKAFTFFPSHEECDESQIGISSTTVLNQHLLVPPNITPIDGNFHSLPNPESEKDPIMKVQRSFSLTCTTSQSTQSSSNTGNWPSSHHCSSYTSNRLRHSNSAPIIGCQHWRRRLSLQSLHSYGNREEAWVEILPPSGKLRRTSSEVYVDRGPDIDSPDRIRKTNISSWTQTADASTSTDTTDTPSTSITSNTQNSESEQNSNSTHLTSDVSSSSSSRSHDQMERDYSLQPSASAETQEVEMVDSHPDEQCSDDEGVANQPGGQGSKNSEVSHMTPRTFETIC